MKQCFKITHCNGDRIRYNRPSMRLGVFFRLSNSITQIRGGWEFDHSHGAGTSSPSHWQQVEEQAPKPVGWTMCFLLMTLVPVQKLCVNIYVYIIVYIPYTSSVIGRIYNGSVIQYWRSCTPPRSIGECAVPDLNAILCFLWFTNCVLLFDNNLILGCLWHCVFV